MADESISGLSETTSPAGSDVLPIVSSGSTKKVTLANLAKGLPTATTMMNGLMTSSQVAILSGLQATVTAMLQPPGVQTITVDSEITIADSTFLVLLQGSGTVTTIHCKDEYRLYLVRYDNGPGATVLGKWMEVGDMLLLAGLPSSVS